MDRMTESEPTLSSACCAAINELMLHAQCIYISCHYVFGDICCFFLSKVAKECLQYKVTNGLSAFT